MRFRPLVGLVGCAALVALVGRASTAQACICNFRAASIVWPHGDARDVPLDAPLVLVAFHVERVQVTLEAEDGTRVELVERLRWEHGRDLDCSNASYAFLTPAAPLAPSTRYLVTRRYDDDPADILNGEPPVLDSIQSFVTGTELRSSTLPDLAVHVFGANSEHGPRTGRMLLELYAETSSLEPLFVLAQGQARPLLRAWDPDPALPTERPYRLLLGAVDCAEYTIVDVAGRTLASESRCQPSKCSQVSGVGIDSCGGEFTDMTWADWQQLPDGCGSATSASDPRTTVIDVVSSPANDARGCGLSTPSSASAWTSSLLCLAAALRRGRRRTAHP